MKEIMTSRNNNVQEPDSNSCAENVYQNTSGITLEMLQRSHRGRKSNRKSSHPLRDIRLSRGLTLEELAEIASLSPSYLSRLESGTRRLNVDTIEKISAALQCNPGDLLVTGDKWIQTQTGTYPSENAQISVEGRHNPYSSHPTPGILKLSIYSLSANNDKIDFSSPIGFIACPPDLMGAPGGFALKIANNIMAPRYRTGDLVLIHPGRPLSAGSTAVVITTDQELIIGEFIAWRPASEVKEFFKGKGELSNTNTKDQYALELKQRQATGPEPAMQGYQQSRNIVVHPQHISSVARIVGTVEE